MKKKNYVDNIISDIEKAWEKEKKSIKWYMFIERYKRYVYPRWVYKPQFLFEDIKFRVRMICQKIFRKDHFSDEEIWNLNKTIANFIIPRLKAYKEKTYTYPPEFKSEKQWGKVLTKIIEGFELYPSDEENYKKINKNIKKQKKNLQLFADHFSNLDD